METVLLYTIYLIEETAKYWFVYYGILNLKTTSKPKRYVSVFMMIAATVVLNVQLFNIEYSLILMINGFLCICILIQCDWRTKVLAFIPVFFFIDLMDTIITILSGCFFDFNPLIMLETKNLNRRLIQLIPSFILLGIVTFLNRNKRKGMKGVKNITWLQYILISLGLVCAAMLTSFTAYIISSGEVFKMYWFKNWFAVFAMGTVVILVLFVLYVRELLEKQKIQNEMLLLYEKQHLLQKNYYQRLYEQSEKLKRFHHDYHHHLYCIKELLQNKKFNEATAYIWNLEKGTEKRKINIIYSGNTVVDAVICGVLGNTEIQDIQFEYRGKLRKNLGVEDVDLCTLLANALENAVEACERCYEGRYIRMECATYKSSIFITICNSCVQRQKKGRTEKKDNVYHGYGMENMSAVTEKYNGSLQYKEEKGKFTLKIYLEGKETI